MQTLKCLPYLKKSHLSSVLLSFFNFLWVAQKIITEQVANKKYRPQHIHFVLSRPGLQHMISMNCRSPWMTSLHELQISKLNYLHFSNFCWFIQTLVQKYTNILVRSGNSTTAKEVSKFQPLLPNPWLVDPRKSTINSLQCPWIESCLMATGPLVISWSWF